MKLKAGFSDQIPEGEILEARLADVELHEFDWNNETVQKLKWKFVISHGEYAGKDIVGETSTAFVAHPNCKAYNWTTALTGKAYAAGEELDTDELIGLPARVISMHKPGKDGTAWVRIRDVLPLRSGPVAEAPF